MPVDDICLEAMERMEKSVETLRQRLRTVRTGRASAGLVDGMRIEYYGALTPLGQIANVATPDPQLIVIRPYDPSVLKEIEKAIQASDLGITPQNDGKFIRLAVPALSEERRRQLASRVRDLGEETKVAVRNVRRDANKEIDREQKDKKIGEDEAHSGKDEVQKATKEAESQIDEIVEKKTEEITAL